MGQAVDCYGVSIDSRTLDEGDLFIAIRGDRFDGHDYVESALNNGAALALVSREHASKQTPKRGGLVVVDDSYAGMYALAQAARARSHAKIVAVTGSVGKTSTKEALKLILSRFGPTHAPEKSFNNHWGVPLTLCRMPTDAQYAVFEIGMNHANEISPLSNLVQPHVAMITTVAPVHLENLGTIEAIAAAKAEIFDGLMPGGAAVVHADIPQTPFLVERATAAGAGKTLTFGHTGGSNAELLQVALRSDCSTVNAAINGRPIMFKVGAPGEHLVVNSIGILAVCEALGLDLAKAGLALAQLQQPAGRGRRHTIETAGDPITVLDESYNANPTSMQAAIQVLSRLSLGPGGKRMAVLGDMLELGEEAETMHRELGQHIARQNVDLVYACGPLMKELWHALPEAKRGAYESRSLDLIEQVVKALRSGDAVMVKGSLGSNMAPVVDALTAKQRAL
ncbi:MAG: UDP-N-acetylmuramoylalanyl-D-glutamyl-2,6-diaminopimelate--D-alanyl-D-alanine ligase [Pseudomonadota bacterium]